MMFTTEVRDLEFIFYYLYGLRDMVFIEYMSLFVLLFAISIKVNNCVYK